MRTVTFQSVYESVLRRHGFDPLGDAITHDTARAVAEHITNRCQTAWALWEWPDLMPTEERAYRSPWNELVQYYRVGENGFPDEVYYIPNATYYKVVATAITEPPFGSSPPTAGTTHWVAFTPTTFVDRDQTGMRPMGQVFGVYATDPSLNGCCTENCLRFRPSEQGITICDGPATTVFVQYLLPEPQFTFVPFISGKSYVAGDRVFNIADGNCYRCSTDNNDQPPPNLSFWVLEPVPAMFRNYLNEGAYADSLIETFASGEDQIRLTRAAAASAKADQFIEGLIDDLLEQGQKHHYIHHCWPHVSFRYDGTIQWPTTGWCCTRPWTGNIVYPLTGLAFAPPPLPLPPPLLVREQNTGTTPLVNGQSYVDVVFDVPQANTDWVFIECQVVNTTDPSPLNVWPGIVTSKTAAGFRLQLNGTPDSDNYYLQWTISNVDFGPVPAVNYALSGPTTGALGTPATFTVHLFSGTTVPATLVVTPSDGGAGGVFTPTAVGLTTASPSAAFTYLAPSAGAKTISATNNGGLIDPSSITFTAAAATGYSMTGPTSGTVGVASTAFTVTLTPPGGGVPAPVTITPSSGGGGGTFTPTTVALTSASPSATFTYTASSAGVKTISATNSGGLTDPASLSYTASAPVLTFNDTFTDAPATPIVIHTADTGQSWAQLQTGSGPLSHVISGGQLLQTGAAGEYDFVSSYTPASANTEATLTAVKGAITGAPEIGIWLRATPDATNPRGYMGRFVEGTGWQFYRLDAGLTYVQLGSNVAGTMTTGDLLRFTISGTGATVTLTLYQNGVSVATVNDTAAGRIVTTGRIGIHLFDPSSGVGDYRVDQITSP